MPRQTARAARPPKAKLSANLGAAPVKVSCELLVVVLPEALTLALLVTKLLLAEIEALALVSCALRLAGPRRYVWPFTMITELAALLEVVAASVIMDKTEVSVADTSPITSAVVPPLCCSSMIAVEDATASVRVLPGVSVCEPSM